MNIHEEAEKEREYNEEANRLLESGGCWIAEDTGTVQGCQGKKTQNGACDCKTCPAYNCFYQVANGYASEDGITWSEAIWLAKQFLDIPSRYMCNGNDEEWMKEHAPTVYNECLRRQAELMGDTVDNEPEPIIEPITEENGQMSIMDWFAENY